MTNICIKIPRQFPGFPKLSHFEGKSRTVLTSSYPSLINVNYYFPLLVIQIQAIWEMVLFLRRSDIASMAFSFTSCSEAISSHP
jgi:hypothetical protein